ncbi:MAG: riboflavin synthase [Hyphomicrobiales bacterium]|nr:riboflavin synthase [Hyphomicrobiales bacterium]
MFTGIVSDVGVVEGIKARSGGDKRFRIACGYLPASLEVGCSIACAGACLTVVAFTTAGKGAAFDVEVSNETLQMTTLGGWAKGTRVNLERALAMGEELGGHLMTGHVDGIAEIVGRRPDGDSERYLFRAPHRLARYIAGKGSVALDGTSLTVNEVEGDSFGVNLIPHTLNVTTWGERREGDSVNLEIDLIARYVARLMAFET